MTGRIIDSLVISLGLNSQGVKKGMDEAERRIKGGVRNIVSNLLAPLAGAFAFNKLINDYTNVADSLGLFSRNIRENINEVQAWTSALEATGEGAEGFKSTLSTIDRQLRTSARFGGRGFGQWRLLGVNGINDENGNLKTSTQVIQELAKAADRLDPERFRLRAERLGIDAGTIRLLQRGSVAVGDLVEKYRDLSYTMEDADNARRYKVAMSDLGRAIQMFSAGALRIAVPLLERFNRVLFDFINTMRKNQRFVYLFFGGLAAIITAKLLPAFLKLAGAILLNPLVIGITLLTVLIGGLALAIDDLFHFMETGDGEFADLWRELGVGPETLEEIRDNLRALSVEFPRAVQRWKDAISEFGHHFEGVIQPFKDTFKNVMSAILNILRGDTDAAVDDLIAAFWSLDDFLTQLARGIFWTIVELFKRLGLAILDSIMDGLKYLRLRVLQNFANIAADIPDFLRPESLDKWIASVNEEVRLGGAKIDNDYLRQGPNAPGNAGILGPLGAAVAGAQNVITTNTDTRVTVNEVNINTDDNAEAMGTAFRAKITERFANAANSGVARQ